MKSNRADNAMNIWVFDIDGVITDPKTKTVTQPKIFDYLHKKLDVGIPIAFNTGRSAEWVEKNIFPFLDKERIKQNIFCSCEMGAVTITFDKKGEPIKNVIVKKIIPEELRNAISDIVNLSYHDSMFIDNTKQVILTIEMKDGFSVKKYQELQGKLESEINMLIKRHHPNIHIQPSSSTIAIDVKPTDFNKKRGAELTYKWLKSKPINLAASKISCFGDSPSDVEMYHFFKNKKLDSSFIYVGNEKLEGSHDTNIYFTTKKFSSGTLETLAELV